MSNYSEVFKNLDTSGNGSISKPELLEGLSQLNMTVEESKVDSFFTLVDVNGDGEISEAEFTAFVSMHHPDNAEFMEVFGALNKSLPALKKLSKLPKDSNVEKKVIIF
jgi:hypothetical protein